MGELLFVLVLLMNDGDGEEEDVWWSFLLMCEECE